MLGKRHRPAMRRTPSMSQLGSCSGIENSPPSEARREEKQRAPNTIAPQSRIPSPPPNERSNNIPILKSKNSPCEMNLNEGNNQSPPVDAFLKGMAPELAVSYPGQPFMGQGQFPSVHGGVKSYVKDPMGNRGDYALMRTESFPQTVNARGPGAQMVEPAHFLRACFLCKRRLGHGRDIYMYRDDRAFCSVECRHQQIVIDERKEKRSIKVMMAGSVPFEHQQNFDKNVKSGTIENVQSKTGATT